MQRLVGNKNLWRATTHIAAWLLAGWLAWDAFTGNLTINPIQAATQRTGRYAIYFLTFSLACTPLNTFFGLRQAISVRRALGVYAALFAGAHFLLFAGLDFGFDFRLIGEEIAQKRYVLAGLLTGSILAALAFTSFRYWQKRLGKNWKRLHRLVYLAAPLAVLHFGWASKGDFLRLQGDILLPFVMGVIVVILLAARLPAARRIGGLIRQRAARKSSVS
jgi:sulfoxide reductase heme-binding subunit YedZ